MDRQSQHLAQQQQLGLKLNPRQVAFGRLLEMSAPEFEDEVRRAIDENPALEVVESATPATANEDFNETAEQLQQADYADADGASITRAAITLSHSVSRITCLTNCPEQTFQTRLRQPCLTSSLSEQPTIIIQISSTLYL